MNVKQKLPHQHFGVCVFSLIWLILLERVVLYVGHCIVRLPFDYAQGDSFGFKVKKESREMETDSYMQFLLNHPVPYESGHPSLKKKDREIKKDHTKYKDIACAVGGFATHAIKKKFSQRFVTYIFIDL